MRQRAGGRRFGYNRLRMSKVKILEVAGLDHFFKYFLKRLIEGMSREGWEVVCACGESGYSDVLRADGLDVRTVPYRRTVNPLAHVPTVLSLSSLIRRERFNVVHVHNPLMSLIGRMATVLARPPLVIYTSHGFYFHEHMPAWKRLVGLSLERLASPVTDFLLTVNSEDAELAVRLGLFRKEQVLVIGNGVDLQVFDPAKVPDAKREFLLREFRIPPHRRIVGMVARYTREKGLLEFLDAAASLRAVMNDVSFIVVGGPASGDRHPLTLTEMERIAGFYGVSDRVVFTGVRDDVPDILSLFDVFVLPSYREGMPCSVLEAMAMEVPVVVTDIRGCREEVTEGVEGCFVPVRDVDTLTDRIFAILNSPQMAAEMGRRGRERVQREFDEKAVVRLQIETIQRLLEERRNGTEHRRAEG